MKTLSQNFVKTTVKNQSIESTVFPANSVILLNYRESVKATGEITTTLNYIKLDDIKDTKPLTIVKTALIAYLSEFKYFLQESKNWKQVKDDTNKIICEDSGIKPSNVLKPFLKTDTIYKTDSNGKISKAVQCSGITLNQTALNLKESHALVSTISDDDKLRFFVHHQANVILKQATYLRDITEIQEKITQKVNEELKEKGAKKETKAA